MSEHPDIKAARELGYREGALRERARCFAIIDSPEAAHRDAQALHLATQTEMSVEDARALLAASPADPQPRTDGTASTFAASVATARGTALEATAEPTGFGASLASIRRRH